MDNNTTLQKVNSIYYVHKKKLDALKENRAKAENDKLSDAEVQSIDDQIKILASILSDLNRQILT